MICNVNKALESTYWVWVEKIFKVLFQICFVAELFRVGNYGEWYVKIQKIINDTFVTSEPPKIRGFTNIFLTKFFF